MATQSMLDLAIRDYISGEPLSVIKKVHHLRGEEIYAELKKRQIQPNRSHRTKPTNKRRVDLVPSPRPSTGSQPRASPEKQLTAVPGARDNLFYIQITNQDLTALDANEFEAVWEALGVIYRKQLTTKGG
jgi:hypothetical protein